ncbi:MAG: hypothetical protein ACT4OO_12440 [Nitrospiraceae bacterium]
MRIIRHLGLLAGFLTLVGCASTVPPSRLSDYLGLPTTESAPMLPDQRPIRAGLLVVADTSAPDAAPTLPDEALERLSASLKEQISQSLPISIEKVIPAEGVTPKGDPALFSEIGRTQAVDYLVVAVVSSTEQEYPISIFLGWTTHRQPGFRRDNWSLVEVALIDVKTGRSVLQAEGRGWATLDSPTAPAINQWYPVIYLRPQDPVRRIWPPTYEGAPNTLRVVAMNQAAKRLILNLQDAWIQKKQTELAQIQG